MSLENRLPGYLAAQEAWGESIRAAAKRGEIFGEMSAAAEEAAQRDAEARTAAAGQALGRYGTHMVQSVERARAAGAGDPPIDVRPILRELREQ